MNGGDRRERRGEERGEIENVEKEEERGVNGEGERR